MYSYVTSIHVNYINENIPIAPFLLRNRFKQIIIVNTCSREARAQASLVICQTVKHPATSARSCQASGSSLIGQPKMNKLEVVRVEGLYELNRGLAALVGFR